MDGGSRFGRDSKKETFIKGYKGREIIENHDCQRPEGGWQIDEHLASNIYTISVLKKNPFFNISGNICVDMV